MQMTSWPATVNSPDSAPLGVWRAGAILFEAYYSGMGKQGDIKTHRLLSKSIEHQEGSNFVRHPKTLVDHWPSGKVPHIRARIVIILVVSEEYRLGNYYEAEQGERALSGI